MSSQLQSIRDTLQVPYERPSYSDLVQYQVYLQDFPDADKYLKQRGISQETALHFQLGYDKDKEAITIPIFKNGKLIGFKYRFIEEGKHKYGTTKGMEQWIFNEDGINKALNKRGILIVEGEFDAMLAWQNGFKNVIATQGTDNRGVWIEQLEALPQIYICFDPDEAGKSAGIKLAERLSFDKCKEVSLQGEEDLADYFKTHTREDFIEVVKGARPYYKYKFSNVGDIINSIRTQDTNFTSIDLVPFVRFRDDWLSVIFGTTNVGKTTYALNIANELATKNIPTLVLPFERGISYVGERFLHVRFNKTESDLRTLDDSSWERLIEDVVDLPIYFSHPSVKDTEDIIRKAKRLFDVKFIVVDHLDLLVRKSSGDYIQEQARTIQMFKELAQKLHVIFLIVHHSNKRDQHQINREPIIQDLKGSGSIHDDPEVIISLFQKDPGVLKVEILKNKGKQGHQLYDFNEETGHISEHIDDFDKY